jgi:PAS domain S-box-containing protein
MLCGTDHQLSSLMHTSSLRDRFSYISVSLGIVVAIIVGASGYWTSKSLKDDAAWADHTYTVLLTTRRLETALINAETGQRGYILTGNRSYLEPYFKGRQSVDQELRAFSELVSDNPFQTAQRERILPLVRSKLDEMQQSIVLHDATGKEQALTLISTDTGKQTMDAIRAIIQETEQHESQLLAQRKVAEEKSLMMVSAIMVVAVLGYLLVGGFAAFDHRRSLRNRSQLQQQVADREKQLRTIVDNVPALIAYVDQEERYQLANGFLKAFGVTDDLIGKTVADVCGPQLYAQYEPHIRAALNGERVQFQGSLKIGEQSVFHESHYIPDIAVNGAVRGYFAMSFDVTQRQATQDALHIEAERLDVTLSSIGDAVITCDRVGCVTYLNPAAERMTGWLSRDALGRPMDEVFHAVNQSTRELIVNPLVQAMRENRVVSLASNTVLLRKDHREIGIDDSAAPIHDRTGNVIGGVMVFHDVSESRNFAARLMHQAQHDNLTDLPNRILVSRIKSRAHARARGTAIP